MIDADLFQMLTLGLLGLILLVALLIYSAVATLRKPGGATQAAPVESAVGPSPLTATAGHYEPSPQPIAQAAPAPVAQTTTAAAQPIAAAAPAAGAEPQDQPFERDGRWWFRRGTDLLVYDERTGQWVAAGAEAGGGAAAPATAAVGTAVLAGEHAGAGDFWKCPSCGAVNGATATTCRMCFTARP